jgi:23S rRNA pseudouridine2605 synthase
MAQERLQKIIARAGVTSRRGAEKLIVEGRVRVNGVVSRTLGVRADPQSAHVEVDGVGVLRAEPFAYILLHKPPYVISTLSDPEGRDTVLDVLERTRAMGKRQFEGMLPRVFPVGRLDFDAEGFVLLTNDGELAYTLLHPKRHVPKTYTVKVRGTPDARALEVLRTGVNLPEEEGRPFYRTAPCEARIVKTGRTNCWLEMILFEGRNHQVKRMCDAIGHPVIRLVRTEFGGIELGDLPTGAWRFLDHPEIHTLKVWQKGS